MTGTRTLTEDEFGTLLGAIEHTAFRLELQPAYAEPCEETLLAAFAAGERPDPLAAVPELAGWYRQVAGQVASGKRVGRVRVQQDPPTAYQRFERWLDGWLNLPAGEDMRYLTVARAYEIDLLPAAGDRDWWLIDSSALIVMRFDDQYRRVENALITDPVQIVQACAWRDLAVHHAAAAPLAYAA